MTVTACNAYITCMYCMQYVCYVDVGLDVSLIQTIVVGRSLLKKTFLLYIEVSIQILTCSQLKVLHFRCCFTSVGIVKCF